MSTSQQINLIDLTK